MTGRLLGILRISKTKKDRAFVQVGEGQTHGLFLYSWYPSFLVQISEHGECQGDDDEVFNDVLTFERWLQIAGPSHTGKEEEWHDGCDHVGDK